MKTHVIDPLIRGLTGFPRAVATGRISALLPSFVSLGLSVLVLFLVWSSQLYPLRSDAWPTIGHPFTADPLLANAWGGPTLIGAWFVHAMAALGMQVVCLVIIRRLNGFATAPAERTP